MAKKDKRPFCWEGEELDDSPVLAPTKEEMAALKSVEEELRRRDATGSMATMNFWQPPKR